MRQEIIERYQKGESAVEIADALGCHWSNVYYHLKKQDIPTNQPHVSKDIDNKFIFLNSESEYWLGFLLADGYIKPAGKRQTQEAIRLRIIDKEHVEKFADFLNFSGAISEENNGSYTVQINNQELVDSVKSFGITERKSLTAKADTRLKNSSHFWRGVIDGDGCLSYNKGRLVMAVHGTQPVCESFHDFVTNNLELRFLPSVRQVEKNLWECRVNSMKSTKIILDLIYKESTPNTRLDKKYNIYMDNL